MERHRVRSGAEKDSHRRKQQGITDILRNISFAGGGDCPKTQII